tara:strand:- start:1099 stop:1392 length:294 start_codon:yes stop_codon:yes gene_type:complete
MDIMDLLKENYSMGIFGLLGFFFHGHFLNALFLAILWEFVEDSFDQGLSKDTVYKHFYEYQSIWKQDDVSRQNKVLDLFKNMMSYYGGHYARNKLPL